MEMTILSATNLKDVNYLSKMETYAILTFAPYIEYTTQVDSKGGVNPHWDEKFGFLVPEYVLQQGEAKMKVEIYTLSTLGPKFVGEVSIPISDVTMSISNLSRFNPPTHRKSYPVKIASGDFQGELQVSFALGEKMVFGDQPPTYPILRSSRNGLDHPSSPSKPSYDQPPYDTEPPLPSFFYKPPKAQPPYVIEPPLPSLPSKPPKAQPPYVIEPPLPSFAPKPPKVQPPYDIKPPLPSFPSKPPKVQPPYDIEPPLPSFPYKPTKPQPPRDI